MDSDFQFNCHEFSVYDSFIPSSTGVYWKPQGGLGESLVLDGEKGELVTAPTNLGKKETSTTKNTAALRSHCEAERRRRERINGHLSALRSFVPSSDKMDKATLLAEVINQVKLLKKQATEASKGLLIPTDTDELTVEPFIDSDGQNGFLAFRASLCCEYKPELIKELRQAINALKLIITKAEISTLGSRMKNVLVLTDFRQEICDGIDEKFAKSIHDALNSVVNKISESEEFSPMTMYTNKRRRVTFNDNSSMPF